MFLLLFRLTRGKGSMVRDPSKINTYTQSLHRRKKQQLLTHVCILVYLLFFIFHRFVVRRCTATVSCAEVEDCICKNIDITYTYAKPYYNQIG